MEHSQPGLGRYLERSWRDGRAASLGHLMTDEKPLGAVLLPSLKNLVPCISWAALGLGTGVCHGGGRDQVDMRLPRPCTVQVPSQLLAFTPG